MKKKLVILISNAGTGTNLQAVIDSIKKDSLNAEIIAIISGSTDAKGLDRAKKNKLKTFILKTGDNGEKLLHKLKPDYIILAGWKRIISEKTMNEYKNRILNIHPGLIPDTLNGSVKNPDNKVGLWNKGKMTEAAIQNFIDARLGYAGSTVHFITHEFDFGPVLARDFEKILPDDTVETLYNRLKIKENAMLVSVLKKICSNKIELFDTVSLQKNGHHYALISVSDKTGIVNFAKNLQALGYRIISTGGTSKTLKDNDIPVVPIQEITGNPESFDGRMKTISFQIESGILYDRTNASHKKQAEELGIKNIDIVVCNLYPFEKTVSNKKVKLEDAVENIDVGGPTMVRAAAKNFKNVFVVVDSNDYDLVADFLRNKKSDIETRQKLAAKAFAHLSFYDSQIASYLQKEDFPDLYTVPGRKLKDLRYGENPHQRGAVYLEPNTSSPLAKLTRHTGRELSLINVTDINAGIESVQFFKESAAVVIKHNTPCGIALGKNAKESLARAIDADPESAFGGVIILNKPMDEKTAEVIVSFKDNRKANIDIVAVPGINPSALELLTKLRKSLGIYTFGDFTENDMSRKNIKPIQGGFIVQDADLDIEKSFKDWEIVTRIKPTKKQLEQMKVAWKFISRIPSNAIIIVDREIPMTRGIGSRQTSRVRSTKLALEQAKDFTSGAILASDSFFPFDDSVKLAAQYGIGAIIEQGDSINDKASIAAADAAGIPMIFTHRRAFWH
jgi:phosphoribosylaminoimidazolecarboxamide formyltransferase/IMP cyclohydrolase